MSNKTALYFKAIFSLPNAFILTLIIMKSFMRAYGLAWKSNLLIFLK